MAKKGGGGGGLLGIILIGAGIWVIQELLKDETESILKWNGWWPKQPY